MIVVSSLYTSILPLTAAAETVTVFPAAVGRVRYASTDVLSAADLCPSAPLHAEDTVCVFVASFTASVLPSSDLRMNPLNAVDGWERVTVRRAPGAGDAPPSCASA